MIQPRVLHAALLGVLAGCPAVDDDDGATDDSDQRPVGVDSELPADTVPGDSEPIDSDNPSDADTDVRDGDRDTDSDAGDTEVVDTEPPVAVPTSFGGVFVDTTAATWTTWPYEVRNQTAWHVEEVPAVPGDLDDDGVVEVLTGNLIDPASPFDPSPVLRRQPDGSWAPDVDAARAVHGGPAGSVLGVVDLDGDGHHDVLRSMAQQTLGLGDGHLGFTWVDLDLVGGAARGYAADAVALVDADRDGWLDVAVSGVYGCATGTSMTLLWRTGPRSWTERGDLVPGGTPVATNLVMPVPLDDGELLFGLLGDACSGPPSTGFLGPSGATTADGLPTWTDLDPLPGDAWLHLRPETAGLTVPQVSPMGGAVVDLDGDDLLEVLVTIAESRQLVFRSVGVADFADATEAFALDFPKLAGTTEREAWGAAPIDLDLDGRPDLSVAQGDDDVASVLPVDTRVSFVRLFWNDGVGHLHDVSTVLGLDATVGNWHTLVAGDVDGDLDLDLVVGGYGRPPRVWRNDTVTTNHALVVRLQGTTSNHLGVGADVRIEADGVPPQRRWVGGEAVSPYVLSEPVLHVGLGAATVARRVEVRWPSGLVQVLADVPAGEVTIREPVTVALSEADRHVPADGVATVDVVVTPRAADGAPRSAAHVDVALAHGVATWAGPVVHDGDRWTRTLVAPASAGSAVVAVTIDGVAVGVRPRVWFDAP